MLNSNAKRANEKHTKPITHTHSYNLTQIVHTHSYNLTQIVHTHSARSARASLALRARPTHAFRSRFALAPPTSPHKATRASLALRARASHIPPQSLAQSLPRPSSRRGLLPCNAPLVGARSRSPRVGEGATLKRSLVLLPRRLLRFVSARSRSPFLSLRKSGGSASFVSPRLAAARSTLPPCCPQSNPTALLRTHHQRTDAPHATHPLADGAIHPTAH